MGGISSISQYAEATKSLQRSREYPVRKYALEL